MPVGLQGGLSDAGQYHRDIRGALLGRLDVTQGHKHVLDGHEEVTGGVVELMAGPCGGDDDDDDDCDCDDDDECDCPGDRHRPSLGPTIRDNRDLLELGVDEPTWTG